MSNKFILKWLKTSFFAVVLLLLSFAVCLTSANADEDESPFIVDTTAITDPIEYGSNAEITIRYNDEDEDDPFIYLILDASWTIDGQEFENPLQSPDGTSLILFPPSVEPGDHKITCQVDFILRVDMTDEEEPIEMFDFPEVEIDYTVKDPPEYEAENVFISTETFDLYIPGIQVQFAQLENRAGREYTYSVLLDESTDESAVFDIVIHGKENGNLFSGGYNLPLISSKYYNVINYTNNIINKKMSRTVHCDMSDAVYGILTEHFYTYYNIDGQSVHNEYTVRFTKNATLFVNEQITDVSSEVGQFENVKRFLDVVKGRETYLVVPYGTESADVLLSLGNGFTGVQVNGGETIEAADHKVTITLAATKSGTDNIIVPISLEGEKGAEFNLVCIAQKYDAMPDAVVEYLCIGSQYTNGAGLEDYGLRPVRSLVGSNYDAGGARENGVGGSGPVSLGNFGGYITYYYSDPITDNPNNPYGIDFITFGNSVEGSNEFGEPGQVWVSEDGGTWYALAGGMHYEDYADWDYQITYIRNEDGTTSWEDNRGECDNRGFLFPLPEYYPYYDFSEDAERITLSGIAFYPEGNTNEFGNVRPPFAGFGYTDSGSKATILPGEDWSDLNKDERELLSARNIAGNPYLGTYWNGNREYSSVTDGMDLAWAVDEDGQPVDVSGMEFHYVKIVTASNIVNSSIGEKSCEVNMVRIAQANDSPVGKTAAPEKITVDGVNVPLEEGKIIYDDVIVDGPFKVAVDAPEGAHVYINNYGAAEVNYDGMPLHKIIRIIVQEGEKEPAIYILNLKETEGEPAPAATLTLDANGGDSGDGLVHAWVNGSATYSFRFDANMSGDPLPVPVNRNPALVFGGWFMGQRLFTAVPSEIRDTVLKAEWLPAEDPPEEETISVTFRLIGSTLAELKDEKDGIDLGDGDYKGAEYVTWIPTTPYEMDENATVADLFIEATEEAGVRSVGADSGYVSTVYAPDELGDYALSEFTNGPRSGWMYTMDGEHTNGINVQKMYDGAEIIFHYVNDYAWEVEDWSWLGGSGWPQLSDEENNYWNKWLEAEDAGPAKDEEADGGDGGQGGSGGESGTAPADAGPEAASLPFGDVAGNAWYYDAVVWAYENEITEGTGETAFSPADDCMREQIVTFLWRAAGKPEPGISSVPFEDVKEGAYYYDAVLWAYEQGITLGAEETRFGVGEPCTREQVVTFLWRAAGKPASAAKGSFSDVESGKYYAEAVAWAKAQGITLGVGDGKFGTGLTCTRAQIVTFLYRARETE